MLAWQFGVFRLSGVCGAGMGCEAGALLLVSGRGRYLVSAAATVTDRATALVCVSSCMGQVGLVWFGVLVRPRPSAHEKTPFARRRPGRGRHQPMMIMKRPAPLLG